MTRTIQHIALIALLVAAVISIVVDRYAAASAQLIFMIVMQLNMIHSDLLDWMESHKA